MNIVLFTALPDAAGAEAPKWVHLVPIGEFRGVDGRGPYRLTDMQAVIAASMARGKIPVDENHATDYAMTTGQPSPARGWIVDMQARTDGLWAEINWTPSGTVLMSEHAYNGISPVMAIDKADKVTVRAVLRAALTNTPNIGDLPTLHSQEPSMDIAALRTALGLPTDADEATVLARVTANATSVTRHSQEIVRLAEAAGAATVTTADGLVTVLASQRANAGDTQRMAQTIVTLQGEVDTMKGERGRDRATAFVDAQITAGKPIRAIRDHYIVRHMANSADVEAELAALPSIHTGGIDGNTLVVLQAQGDGGGDWTAQEKMTCERMGVSKSDFLKTKAKKKAGMMGAA